MRAFDTSHDFEGGTPRMREAGTEVEARASAPGCGGYVLAAFLATIGSFAGTVWTIHSWADCPLGNDAGGNLGLHALLLVMWLCMTLLLALLQFVIQRWPLPGGRATRWLVLLVGAVALTLLYRVGMDWPYYPAAGPCVDGYPLFPFTGKTGPGYAG
ncbi:hypothetical protein ACFYVL_02820 [Streptomyces sp. NPDC004111]|uniref:hypothetical protein n=1 Tax=Streptomyces sp. NPDC004111 TaxID=3364690 RepID=UPI003677D3A8